MNDKTEVKELNRQEQELVAKHVDYAAKIVRTIAEESGMDLDGNNELFQELRSLACYSMVICASRYKSDNKKGASFVTFCTPYIKGALNHYIHKTACGVVLQDYQYKKIAFLSLDMPVGCDDDSYTLEETIASPDFGEQQRASEAKEILGLIKASLEGDDLKLFNELQRNHYDVKETVRELAKKRGISERLLYSKMNALFGKMREIGLTLKLR